MKKNKISIDDLVFKNIKHDYLHFLDGKLFSGMTKDLGTKRYFLNGKYHREDGPALISFGHKSWYYNGEFIYCKDNEEFLRIIKLKIFE